ncbi:hypothetical protein B0H10DRAFT_1949565 [Mycena sp. CBHHK59/15]|nr:hypothetical protein B0H10DRAFT_1949565 [Mycena sp. CBHHK59/15]
MSLSGPVPAQAARNVTEQFPNAQQIEDELCLLDLEDADSLLGQIQDLITQSIDDFPEEKVNDDAAKYATQMTRASITDQTRAGHMWHTSSSICVEIQNGMQIRSTSKLLGILQYLLPKNVALLSKALKVESCFDSGGDYHVVPNRSIRLTPYSQAWSSDLFSTSRKQAQTGLLHSWKLHANDNDPKCSRCCNAKPANGFNKLQTANSLSRSLSKDLQGLGYASWALYSTHSFRRGRCQYRIKVKKWTADMVAAWGGWSQVEAVTMFRYFYSPNDNHEYMEDYDKNL